jgi:hypothetical protein
MMRNRISPVWRLFIALERGFAAFAAMGDAKSFLAAIESSSEFAWIADMFDMNLVECTQH